MYISRCTVNKTQFLRKQFARWQRHITDEPLCQTNILLPSVLTSLEIHYQKKTINTYWIYKTSLPRMTRWSSVTAAPIWLSVPPATSYPSGVTCCWRDPALSSILTPLWSSYRTRKNYSCSSHLPTPSLTSHQLPTLASSPLTGTQLTDRQTDSVYLAALRQRQFMYVKFIIENWILIAVRTVDKICLN
jgi:hypothetical protein